MQGVNVRGLLLVAGDQRLQIRTRLRLHVLAHEDGASLTATPLDLFVHTLSSAGQFGLIRR